MRRVSSTRLSSTRWDPRDIANILLQLKLKLLKNCPNHGPVHVIRSNYIPRLPLKRLHHDCLHPREFSFTVFYVIVPV